MRIVSLILAIAVGAGLYFWIIERERTLAFIAGAPEAAETEATATSEDAAASAPDEEDAATGALIKVVARASIAREIDNAVILRGQTAAARQVEIRAETSSTVISPPLRKGAFVEAGQLMCELDPGTRESALAEARARLAEAIASKTEAQSRVPEAESRVIEAQARIDEALVNQNAARRLSEDGFAAETRVKNAEAAVAAAEASREAAKASVTAAKSGLQSANAAIESATASIATAEKELERLEIRAPFSGLLESDTAELGTLLQQGSLCATVIQLDPIKLVAYAPETEVARIEVGALAGARLAAGGQEVTGEVTFLSRAADEMTRTFRVEIEVPNADLKIRDGQTAEIAISAAGEKAHLLPSSALTLNEDGALGLRTVDGAGVVAFNPATVVRDTAQGIWLAGLPDEINVIVVGQEFVTAGVTVAPTFQEQTQ
ncbi:efflux RND transporter periplasmic adaptor subunit [Tateyamaria omphalii]|uniref:efflux RND transporter periplasmic adaptor subunit n=1 Tax=Tateyamaria omphalii TaxID=299262 RepID=UPI001C9905D9|nr:efflux RND transporter periplasmic adaptor subunit [Tateyamaria omphalii]MBY5934008.1 efflux RND transporter periplasmic adaptor subunit [Tateyamaria omphalii]